MNKLKIVSWFSTVTGMLGSLLVSFGHFEGFYLFIASSLSGALLLKHIKQYPLMYLNIYYFFVNLNGIFQLVLFRGGI